MKVYKVYSEDYYYMVSATTEKEAIDCALDWVGDFEVEKLVEVPESEWDKKDITMYEDNNMSDEPYFVSIREQMSTGTPEFICTNDSDMW